jgi:hypothetical protein
MTNFQHTECQHLVSFTLHKKEEIVADLVNIGLKLRQTWNVSWKENGRKKTNTSTVGKDSQRTSHMAEQQVEHGGATSRQ